MTLITATACRRDAHEREPRPGRVRREVRGPHDLARTESIQPAISGRRHVWLPSVIASAPSSSSFFASFGVIPTPSAAFSPLTMQTSTSSSSRSAGSRASSARRPGAPTTSATKRRIRAAAGREPREDLQRHVVARVLRVAGERLALDAREVEHLADPVAPAATAEPTVSDGSGCRRVTETMSAGAVSGRMSMRMPCAAPFSTYGVMPAIVPSTGA